MDSIKDGFYLAGELGILGLSDGFMKGSAVSMNACQDLEMPTTFGDFNSRDSNFIMFQKLRFKYVWVE
jgi:hypothetical protein